MSFVADGLGVVHLDLIQGQFVDVFASDASAQQLGGFDLVLSSSYPFLFGYQWMCISKDGAGEGTRTLNLRITNPVLYQLSYASPDSDTRRPPTREAFVGRNAFVRVAVRSPGRVRNR